MKILKLLIKGLAYAFAFEFVCFILTYLHVTNENDLLPFVLLLLVFIVFASAFEFVKGKDKHNLLFIIPILIIHLVVAPCRESYMHYINRYDTGFGSNLGIFLIEIYVALFIATIILYDVVFFFINLMKKAIVKKSAPKSFKYQWVIKGVLFVIVSDLTLYASMLFCINDPQILKLLFRVPLLLLPAISFRLFKGDSEHPLFYNLVVFGTHIALSAVRILVLLLLDIRGHWINIENHLEDNDVNRIVAFSLFSAIFIAIWALPLIIDTVSCLIKLVPKKGSNTQAVSSVE